MLPGFLPTLFPPLERYSGVAFHYTFGQALFGGTTPLIATALVAWTGNSMAPAFYLVFSSNSRSDEKHSKINWLKENFSQRF